MVAVVQQRGVHPSLPAISNEDKEVQSIKNIEEAAQEDAGFFKSLKFRKGHFFLDDTEVPIGTQYTVDPNNWVKQWLKFGDGKVLERKLYRVRDGVVPPKREALGDLDRSKWAISEMNGQPQDPWVLQYLLPMEDEKGETALFVTSSFGGKRACGDVCAAWTRKKVRNPQCGQPIVKIREVMMPTTKFGNVPRPAFEIVGWDDVRAPSREIKAENIKDDMNDEIPF